MIAPSHNAPRRNSGRAPTTVKYSLPEMLEEIATEKSKHGAPQKVAQADIARLFQTQSRRRRG